MHSPKNNRPTVNATWLEIGRIFLEAEIEMQKQRVDGDLLNEAGQPARPADKPVDGDLLNEAGQ